MQGTFANMTDFLKKPIFNVDIIRKKISIVMIKKKYMSNIFRDVVFVLAAVPNRLSRDKIIFSENHISLLCLVLCNEDTEVASQREGASKKVITLKIGTKKCDYRSSFPSQYTFA